MCPSNYCEVWLFSMNFFWRKLHPSTLNTMYMQSQHSFFLVKYSLELMWHCFGHIITLMASAHMSLRESPPPTLALFSLISSSWRYCSGSGRTTLRCLQDSIVTIFVDLTSKGADVNEAQPKPRVHDGRVFMVKIDCSMNQIQHEIEIGA